MAVLVGVVLQSIGTVRLGPHFYVSLGILFLGSYLSGTFIWELAREKIELAVGSITGARQAARPWDLIMTPAEASKIPITKFVSNLGVSLLVTLFVASCAWGFVTLASGSLSQLAEFRITTTMVLGALVLAYRSVKGPVPTAGRTRIGAYFIGKAIVAGYYWFQLWLASMAFSAVSIVESQGPGLILIVLEGAGILSIGRVIWWIAWPLVNDNANAMGALSRIHDGIVSGQYVDADAISRAVAKAYLGEGKSQ